MDHLLSFQRRACHTIAGGTGTITAGCKRNQVRLEFITKFSRNLTPLFYQKCYTVPKMRPCRIVLKIQDLAETCSLTSVQFSCPSQGGNTHINPPSAKLAISRWDRLPGYYWILSLRQVFLLRYLSLCAYLLAISTVHILELF
jgi:hypothetical protein